jgi:hypothetical protein
MPFHTFSDEVLADYRHFYTIDALLRQGLFLAMGGIMANTDFDPKLQATWQSHIRTPFSQALFNPCNTWGDMAQYSYAIPFYTIAMCLPLSPVSCWANHTLRALLLGGPPQAILSYSLGAGRPVTDSPRWDLFKYHRAISGHAFYGALPFINMAMMSQSQTLQGFFYIVSVLPGLARVNNNSHYFSQVFLGWWLAYSASNTAWQQPHVSKKSQSLSFQVKPSSDGISLEVWKKF